MLLPVSVLSQPYRDTVFLRSGDTVICHIIVSTGTDLIYETPAGGKSQSAYIPVMEVKRVSAKPSEDAGSRGEQDDGLREQDGIIFPASLESPPVYASGLAELYFYLEKLVPVRTRDSEIFGRNPAVTCFRLEIDSAGRVKDVWLEESTVEFQGFGMGARHFEEAIRTNILKMPAWKPAVRQGMPVPCQVYLPLRFRLQPMQMMLMPVHYLHILRHRRDNG